MENNSTNELTGRFRVIIYKSSTYMVSKFETDEGLITITGPSFDCDRDEKYLLKGSYVYHPKYGHQFNYISVEKHIPDTEEEVIAFLKSSLFPGIGKSAAQKIYDYYGDDTLKLLKSDPNLVFNLPLTEKQLSSLFDGFSSLTDPKNETLYTLISGGFSNVEAQKIFNKFKTASLEVGNSNPFRFYIEVPGISFNKVKDYALRIGFEDLENRYAEAYLIYLMREYTFNTGSVYLNKEEFQKFYTYIPDFETVLDRAIDDEYIVNEEERYYLFSDYNDEIYISNFLNYYHDDFEEQDYDILSYIEEKELQTGISLDEEQKNAVSSFFSNRFSIIVGGPGTGKTTIVKMMVDIYKEKFPYSNIIVVAPTGRAAKRVGEICDVESKTIHSLLRWDKETNTFVFGVDNPILYEAIIIDEFSMVDSSLFACLLKACSNVKKICVIGDSDQLPSIRPGNVLGDLIGSDAFSCTHLKTNYRQNKGSEIIDLAHDVMSGNFDSSKFSKDVQIIDYRFDMNKDLVSMISKDLDEGYSLDEIQVLAPMYRGEFGIDNLNILLQESYNGRSDDKREKLLRNIIFREGDKILQLKNRPSDDVYNGDIGTLIDVDLKEKTLLVDFNDIYVYYNFEDTEDISLAYAMSVHKSQGSEYKNVYFVIPPYHSRMLTRQLLYTGITRAKNKLVIITDSKVFREGLNKTISKRNSGLIERLQK